MGAFLSKSGSPARRKLSIDGPSGATSFASFGMVVLDELRFPSKPTLYDVVGGSGAYSTLGARLTCGGEGKGTIGFVILAGSDFPASIVESLGCWHIDLHIKYIPQSQSTRGLLIYEDDAFGRKTFKYTTTPLQPEPRDLADTRSLQSTAFHLLAQPKDLEERVAQLLLEREARSITAHPLLVWEPAPPSCNVAHRDAHLQACQKVDVFSPNHLELIRLFEDDATPAPSLDRSLIERYARRLLHASDPALSSSTQIVVRAGEHGCYLLSSSSEGLWLPAYFDANDSAVVDPTGAGNCFLGAFTRVLGTTGDLTEAAVHGTVAASYAIEQFGLPALTSSGGRELWNGSAFTDRLDAFKKRLSSHVTKSQVDEEHSTGLLVLEK